MYAVIILTSLYVAAPVNRLYQFAITLRLSRALLLIPISFTSTKWTQGSDQLPQRCNIPRSYVMDATYPNGAT